MSREGFLGRWSRLKKVAEKTGETVPLAEIGDAETLLKNLGPESDFGVFLREEISEEVRRQAMKKLFADPHFNVMDGLDTYIDDYSISESIPQEMLAGLRQMQELIEPQLDEDIPPLTPSIAAESCDNLTCDGQKVPDSAPEADFPTKNQ